MTKIAFLYATFPRPTETFVRRELRQLGKWGFTPRVISIWKGSRNWEGFEVSLFPLLNLFRLIFWLPYWAWKKPRVFKTVLSHLWGNPCPGLQNWNETFLGLGFALVKAKEVERLNYSRFHAVWATMPATAALGINRLVGIPFSTGAHAYDVFRNRGDWLLPLKLQHAVTVRTSSQSTAKRLKFLGVTKDKLAIIHRSIERFDSRENFELNNKNKLSLLSVGRLVEKKGYFLLLRILQVLDRKNIPFELNIIGGGKMENEIRREIHIYGLHQKVNLLGHLDGAEIERFYRQSDSLLFTGIIATNGDRDGIPNVIPEAMASGLLILASNRAGSSEAFVDQKSGFSLDPYKIENWVNLLENFYQYPNRFSDIRKSAIKHAKSKFSADVNCLKLESLFE